MSKPIDLKGTDNSSLPIQKPINLQNKLDFTSVLEQIKTRLQASPHTSTADPLQKQEVMDRETDRDLKKRYANWFIGILICQLLIMNIIFILTGLGVFNFAKWVIEIFISGTLLEVFGIVRVITSHLFPTRTIKK